MPAESNLILNNEFLRIDVAALGAELQSIYHRKHQLKYLWSGDRAFWGKHSPILFPIVGTLKENKYSFQGQSFSLGRHGFAREMPFSIEAQTETSVIFLLVSDTETLKKFPFPFELRIEYSLLNDLLQTNYRVTNSGSAPLYFSIGGHPAFRLPIAPDTEFSDYYLRFNKMENLSRWPISADGLIEEQPIPLINQTDRLNLVKALFYQDALVFKNPASDSISILSNKTPHGLTLHFPGFPYFGIWSAKDADFVCLEPWCGIADSVTADGSIERKEGINTLAAGAEFLRSWQLHCF